MASALTRFAEQIDAELASTTNAIPYGRNQRAIPLEERHADGAPLIPPRISLERTSRTTVYEQVLAMAATRREENIQAEPVSEDDHPNKDESIPSAPWVNPSRYAHSIAEIVYDTTPKNKDSKKTE